MPNYQNGKIYKIVNDDLPDLIYYGSTTLKLCDRIKTHKYYSKKKNKGGSGSLLFKIGKPKILLVENFSCNTKEELLKRERFYIENNKCINIEIPGRTKKELYEDKKEFYNKSILCNCGGKYSYKHKTRHEQTNKHKKYLETI